MKVKVLIALVISVALIGTNTTYAPYSGGTGEPNNPYKISTPEDLDYIGNHSVDWDKHFVMVNDINLAEFSPGQLSPIGHWPSTAFTGTFDGNGLTISGLRLVSCGIFDYVRGEAAAIRDLGLLAPCADEDAAATFSGGPLVRVLKDGEVTGCYAIDVNLHSETTVGNVGGLVRSNDEGRIHQCYTTGIISGKLAGGIAANNTGTISDCFSTTTVLSSYERCGGIVGSNEGIITNCVVDADITGCGIVGGIAGSNSGLISYCRVSGTVRAEECGAWWGDEVGGVAGYIAGSGQLINCYSNANVFGMDRVGGITGSDWTNTQIDTCYYTGEVSGRDLVGGLVGEFEGPISNSYAQATVTGRDRVGGAIGEIDGGTMYHCYCAGPVSGTSYIGGMCGYADFPYDITKCFWDQSINPSLDDFGVPGWGHAEIIAESTENLQIRSTYTNAGWDFVIETDNGIDDIWTIHEGEDYPKLVWKLVNLVGWYEVDFIDYSFFTEHWMDTNCGDANDCDRTDLDFSDTVDANDLKIFCDHWLEGM